MFARVRGPSFDDWNYLNVLNDWNNSPGEAIERTLRLAAQGSRISRWAFFNSLL